MGGGFFSSAPSKADFMSAPISGIQTSVGAMPHDPDFAQRMMTYTPSEAAIFAGPSGLHPSIESGYGISSAALADPKNRGGLFRANITPSFNPMQPPVLDVNAYEKAYNRWSLIENERRKRLNYALGLAGSLGRSGGSSASGGGGGGGAGKRGGGGRQTQMASMGVSDKPEDPFRKLEDFYPFMKNYRIT
jgi:hypothetical protein